MLGICGTLDRSTAWTHDARSKTSAPQRNVLLPDMMLPELEKCLKNCRECMKVVRQHQLLEMRDQPLNAGAFFHDGKRSDRSVNSPSSVEELTRQPGMTRRVL